MLVAMGVLGLGLVAGCQPAKVPPDLMARLDAAANKSEAAANKSEAAAKATADAAARAEAAADKLGGRYAPYK
jgi:hypothetical protein